MASNNWLLFTVLIAFVCSSYAAECNGKPNPNAQPNMNTIQTSPPKFIKSIKNGKLYTVGTEEEMINIVHVWGTPYEMGYAHGTLMKETVRNMVTNVWKYLKQQIIDAVNGKVFHIPNWFLEDVANFGLDEALGLEYAITNHYSGAYFEEEIKGLAAATGLEEKKIRDIHMIGELTKGACSMFGANASATADGGLLQLRALDWNVDGPFKNYPQITVYHPNTENGHDFANIGWTGWIGSITGISSVKIAISEIGVSFPDETFGEESRFGIPFTYILRDILQFDKSLEDAMDRLSSAHRTCDLILGVGDGKVNEFRGVEYSHTVADFFTYDNLRPTADWHPKIKDIVYWGMDWLCPGYSDVMARQLSSLHGNLTAANTISSVVPIVQTGDLHVAVYDLPNQLLYVANARAENETGPDMAYDRAFVRLDMATIFSEKPPSS